MKVTCGELIPMLEGLKVVLDKEFVDMKAAYWLGRAQAQITTELQPFEQARRKLIQKHGVKDDEGNLPEIGPGEAYPMVDMEAFATEFNELAEEEVEIGYNPISVDRLAGIKGVTGVDIAKLGRLINDDVEEAKPAKPPKILEMPEA